MRSRYPLCALIACVLAVSAHALVLGGGAIKPSAAKAATLGGRAIRPLWFDADIAPVIEWRTVAPSTSTEITTQDRVYARITGATQGSDVRWGWRVPPGRSLTDAVTRTTSNAAVVTPDPADTGRWLYVGPGTATITLSNADRTISETVTTSTQGGTYTDTLTGYVAGSLRRHLIDAVDTRLAGKSAASALRMFSTYTPTNDTATSAYVRNAQCWAADVDLTPISPGNTGARNLWAGILISPRHVLFCAHAYPATGSIMHFVAMDGTLVTRTLTAAQTVAGYTSYYPDLRVGLLDSDVPGSISFARVLPDNWTTKLPNLSAIYPVPALTLDQEEKALVTDLQRITAATGQYGAMASFAQPTDAQRLAFYESKIGGDSGNPACLIINGQLVVLTVWTFGGAGSGTSITYHRSAINTIMTAQGGGYQLTDADLSGFQSY